MTPTARSTKWLRDHGWIVTRVEQRLAIPDAPYPITRDAFGFGDLLAANVALPAIALIQATSQHGGGHHNARIQKILFTTKIARDARAWIRAGGDIQVHSWAKRGPRGERKRWQVRRTRIILLSATGQLKAIDIED